MEFVCVFLMQLFIFPFVMASSFLPYNCPATCGDVNISYPFGVGEGCFRPGFELTCNHSTNPPMLFIGNQTNFQVSGLQINYGFIDATTGIAVMPSNMKNYTVTWSLPNDGLYLLDEDNSLIIVGCGIVANLIYERLSVGGCVTICDSKQALKDASGSLCNNTVGCCQIPINGVGLINSYMLQLTREEESNNLNQDYDVKVFLSLFDRYIFMADDVYTSNRFNTTTGVEVLLYWSIPSSLTCEAAKVQNDTYACLSIDSSCQNASDRFRNMELEGYNCECYEGHYDGNPYIPGGCQDLDTTQPKLQCPNKCGEIGIPFPLGTMEGCYRNRNFNLFCDTATKHKPTLIFKYADGSEYPVNKILLEEGLIQVDITEETIYKQYQGIMPFFYYNDSRLFNWGIDYMTCDQANNMSTYACVSKHSSCVNKNLTKNQVGYHCRCNQGYEGNPYLAQGCKDMNECLHPEKYCLNGTCHNFDGSYICCGLGASFNPINKSCVSHPSRNLPVGFYVGIGFGIGLVCLLLSIGMVFGKRVLRKRIQSKLRQKFFHLNHGLLLQKLISCNGDTSEQTKNFTWEELEKATTNFDQSRVVGQGGHGTVFKGLLSDQRVVAIKKSKLKIKREIDQFINEVVILSRINHRNIVKLFGCCLETEVPLLVYEFVSNGTLYNHLHAADSKSTLSWEDRLRIASETVGALSYLHSAASISIFHRDVKSANILLDDYLTAKVSDFGASRIIPVDKTHVATGVQGTLGYLDPEYHHTGQLTEKSDVYSFGVIMAELLTGESPISSMRAEEEMYLSVHFLRAIKDNRIFELVEARVKEESTTEELDEFIHLAEICLRLKGEERPTMKEVEFKIQCLIMIRKQRDASNKARPNNISSSVTSCQAHYNTEAITFPCDGPMLVTSGNQSITLPTCPR